MAAELIVRMKHVDDEGFIVDIKIWKLPKTSLERLHGLKYSLYFGINGERIICYDNEKGKGDHRHYRLIEEPYRFVSLEKLIIDFEEDINMEREKK